MSGETRRTQGLDTAWILLMLAASTAIAVLNAFAVHTFHTIDKHLTFRDRILAGFPVDPVARTYPTPPTFPMWGYGWVLVLTTSKPVLIAIQIAAAAFAAWLFVTTVERIVPPDRRPMLLLRAAILACTPWYVYHSIDWSQSLATSALIVSLALLISACQPQRARTPRLAASAICFGVNLNFASDLYLLPVAIAATYWWLQRDRPGAVWQSAAWLGIVFTTLAPWMIYSVHVVGSPLVKSTNQGHVLLIGLGQDPQHRFDVSYSDIDPTMGAILDGALGPQRARQSYESCSFEADPVLRQAFLQRVSDQPWAYLDVVRWRLTQVLLGRVGVYAGEFDSAQNVGRFHIGPGVRWALRRVTASVGSRLQQATALLLPFAAWGAARRRSAALALAVVSIAYQYVSCSVAAMQPQYVQNVLVFQLFLCAEFGSMVFGRIRGADRIAGRLHLAHG